MIRARSLLACVLLLSGCATSVVVSDVSVERLHAALRSYDPNNAVPGKFVHVNFIEWRHDQAGSFSEVTGEGQAGFRFVPILITLGLWIPCDFAVRVIAYVDEAGWRAPLLRLEARVLRHHQLLFVLPVVWSDDELEQRMIDDVLARARAVDPSPSWRR